MASSSVSPDDQRVTGVARIARSECHRPRPQDGAKGFDEPAKLTLDGLKGRVVTVMRIPPDEANRLIRQTIASKKLLEWPPEDTRFVIPRREGYLRQVIALENRRAAPSRELIEHCAAAIEEVSE